MKSLSRSKLNFQNFYKTHRVMLKQELLPLLGHAVDAPEAFLAFFCPGTLLVSHSLVLKKAQIRLRSLQLQLLAESLRLFFTVQLTHSRLVDLFSILESCLFILVRCIVSTKLGAFFACLQS